MSYPMKRMVTGYLSATANNFELHKLVRDPSRIIYLDGWW